MDAKPIKQALITWTSKWIYLYTHYLQSMVLTAALCLLTLQRCPCPCTVSTRNPLSRSVLLSLLYAGTACDDVFASATSYAGGDYHH